jgi:endonuclease III
MATPTHKQKLLNLLFTSGKKILEGREPTSSARACTRTSAAGATTTAVSSETRPVLEEVIYALCRENASREQADQAYQRLRDRFYDWNEVRVSTYREVEESFAGLEGSESRAQRLISFLQEVFETTFSFILDELGKQGLKQAAKKLGRFQAANDYVGAWVMQRSLGGHAIPVDEPTLRCSQRLGLVDVSADAPDGARATLEHLIPKARGPLFTDVISTVARDYCVELNPDCPHCPLSSECPTGQHREAEPAKATRAKPR